MTPPDTLDRGLDLLFSATGILVAAGAGMGVDPGHPDFRGADGFWRAYPALATAGLDLRTSRPCRAPFTTFLGLPGAFRASAEPLSPSGAARGLQG